MLRIEDSKKKVISIGHYKVLDTIQTSSEKDLFHVKDLKTPYNEYLLRILKSNQNPKQIDNEIEVLERLNPYKESVNFHQLEIFSDKLLFIFDYIDGSNLQDIYEKNNNFFDELKIKKFVDSMKSILEIYAENAIVHRDIKPENIIFDGENYFVVGFSKAVIDTKQTQLEDIKGVLETLYFLITGKKLDVEVNLTEEKIHEIYEQVKIYQESNTKESFAILREYINKL